MSKTNIAIIDRTVQKTYQWLGELMTELDTENPETAYAALHATLHALRDRLTVDEAAQLAAQLPMLVRGIYYEGWDPSSSPSRERHKNDFLDHVRLHLRGREDIDAEEAARAVFSLLAKRVSDGEIQDIVSILPHELREMWQPVAVS